MLAIQSITRQQPTCVRVCIIHVHIKMHGHHVKMQCLLSWVRVVCVWNYNEHTINWSKLAVDCQKSNGWMDGWMDENRIKVLSVTHTQMSAEWYFNKLCTCILWRKGWHNQHGGNLRWHWRGSVSVSPCTSLCDVTTGKLSDEHTVNYTMAV